MRVCRIVFLSLLLAVSGSLWAQQPAGNGVVVDYNNPKKYIVGGVKIEGTQADHNSRQFVSF